MEYQKITNLLDNTISQQSKFNFIDINDDSWETYNANSQIIFKTQFNEVYSRDNLPDKIKDGACVINPNECADISTR